MIGHIVVVTSSNQDESDRLCNIGRYVEEEDEWSKSLMALEGKAKQASNEKDWEDVISHNYLDPVLCFVQTLFSHESPLLFVNRVYFG